jgi:hypothetical protein
MSEKKPYNAGDETSVEERKGDAKRREDIRREGLRYIMGDARGRAWMAHLLREKLFVRLGTRRTPIFSGSSSTFFNCALHEVGEMISTELYAICLDNFRKMEDEAEKP